MHDHYEDMRMDWQRGRFQYDDNGGMYFDVGTKNPLYMSKKEFANFEDSDTPALFEARWLKMEEEQFAADDFQEQQELTQDEKRRLNEEEEKAEIRKGGTLQNDNDSHPAFKNESTDELIVVEPVKVVETEVQAKERKLLARIAAQDLTIARIDARSGDILEAVKAQYDPVKMEERELARMAKSEENIRKNLAEQLAAQQVATEKLNARIVELKAQEIANKAAAKAVADELAAAVKAVAIPAEPEKAKVVAEVEKPAAPSSADIALENKFKALQESTDAEAPFTVVKGRQNEANDKAIAKLKAENEKLKLEKANAILKSQAAKKGKNASYDDMTPVQKAELRLKQMKAKEEKGKKSNESTDLPASILAPAAPLLTDAQKQHNVAIAIAALLQQTAGSTPSAPLSDFQSGGAQTGVSQRAATGSK
jgi:hypothetical protein